MKNHAALPHAFESVDENQAKAGAAGYRVSRTAFRGMRIDIPANPLA
jgi:hypothetical protein